MRMAKKLKYQIGQRMREIRDFHGVNQALFGMQVGVNQALISKYEIGDLETPDHIKLQLYRMGVSLDWLITGEGQMFRTPDNKPSFQIDKGSSSKTSFSEDLKTLMAETRAIRMLNKEILDTIRTQGGTHE